MNKFITFVAVALLAIPTCLLAAQSPNLESVLLDAAAAGQTNLVKSFLDNGANVEVKNEAGATPLIFASAKGHSDVVKLLLERGANVNAKTTTGITPLMAAASGGYVDIVKLLLAKAANVSAKDQQSRTALDIAQATGNTQVQALLKSHERVSGMASAPVAAPQAQIRTERPAAAATAQLHEGIVREADSSAGLTVRAEPSSKGQVIAYLPAGAKVTYVGEASNGWLKLSVPIRDGWIAASFSRVRQFRGIGHRGRLSRAMPSSKERSGNRS